MIFFNIYIKGLIVSLLQIMLLCFNMMLQMLQFTMFSFNMVNLSNRNCFSIAANANTHAIIIILDYIERSFSMNEFEA